MKCKTHQYQLRKLGKNKDYKVYACVNCTHYVEEALILGRECLCNRCKKESFRIIRQATGKILHKPHCDNCTFEPRTKKIRGRKKVDKIISDFVQDIMGGIK